MKTGRPISVKLAATLIGCVIGAAIGPKEKKVESRERRERAETHYFFYSLTTPRVYFFIHFSVSLLIVKNFLNNFFWKFRDILENY